MQEQDRPDPSVTARSTEEPTRPSSQSSAGDRAGKRRRDIDETVPSGDRDKDRKAAPQRLDWKKGAVIAGRYFVRRNLGVGGTGLVVVADDLLLRKPVAVKALRPSVARDPDNVERFRKEVALCHAVTHPNIVRTYDLGQDRGVHYFSMEYLTGTPLSRRLKESKKLPARQVRRLGIHICRALEAAHEAKVVHRDLKPSNIMLTDDGREVVVMDFGISGMVYEREEVPEQRDPDHGMPTPTVDDVPVRISGEWDVTSAGWGTPKYMSPEQWRGEPCGPESDIYSLGAILFQCLAGRPPFQGMTDRDFAAKHINQEAPSVRSLEPSVPRSLDSAIARCLRKRPEERFRSARDLADALAGRRRIPGWLRLGVQAVGLALVLGLLGWGVMAVAHRAIIREMRPAVSRLAALAAQEIDPDDLDRIRHTDDVLLPEFGRIRQYFIELTEENPEVHFIYTLRARPQPGQWDFVVDRDPFPEDDNHNGWIEPEEMGALPGQPYDGTDFPAMTQALIEGRPTADRAFAWDLYGLTLSGYAPIGSNRGEGGYVLGIDVTNARLVWFDRIVMTLCVLTLLVLLSSQRLLRLVRGWIGGETTSFRTDS